jgi:signal peptidase II
MIKPQSYTEILNKKNNPARIWLAHKLRPYLRFWVLAGATLVLDQLTKWLVICLLPETLAKIENAQYVINRPVEVTSFFNLVHVYNPGAAFSMFSGFAPLLVVLAIVAVWAIFHWRRQFELERPVIQIAFGIIVGGIAGNVVDRLLRGEVLDFLDFHIGTAHWPAFNVADIGICAGVGLYLLANFRSLLPAAAGEGGQPHGAAPTAGTAPTVPAPEDAVAAPLPSAGNSAKTEEI